jgi:hypothetical protein
MAEYLAPGVYLEESSTGMTPIPGVSASTLDTGAARALLDAIEPVIKRAQPGWTSTEEADPGITLIQFFAWVTAGLLYRSDAAPDRRRSVALTAAADVTAAAGACAADARALQRPSYFTGQLLTAADLVAEQDYHREKQRLHNRHLHGWGIVSGLDVRVDATPDSDGVCIVIEPGYAIDRCGEEIAVRDCIRLPLPGNGDTMFVSLRHWEHPASTAGNRIEEACLIAIVAVVAPSALAIGRLVRADSGWTVDPAFAPARGQST